MIPHDPALERHVCGAALLGAPQDGLLPEAFHDRGWREVWQAICEEGARPDPTMVEHRLGEQRALVVEAMAACSMISGQERRIDQLRELHHRRQIQTWSTELHIAATEGGDIDDLLAKVPVIDSGLAANELTAETVEAWRARPAENRPDWVIPGLMRRGWRCVVVAREGVGKMVLLRQMAIASSQGVHPFTWKPIDAIRTLTIDFENPGDVIDAQIDLVLRGLGGELWMPNQAFQWRRPAGINIREHRWKIALDRIISQAKPDLVCMGPLYKSFRQKANEQWEEVAVEVCNALDDLRTRHGFALVLEHHAAKGEKTARGSAVWLGWPELGIFLDVETQSRDGKVQTVRVDRFRGDRGEAEWPEKLTRGRTWPWEARYPGGSF